MATKNLVPRNSGEGGIGRLGKPWATGFYDALFLNEVLITGLDSNKMDGFSMNQNLNTSDNIVFASGNFSDGLTVNGINVLTGINRTGQMLDEEVDSVAANLVITGSFLHDQITSNDTDITTLTTNLNTTGQLLDEEVDLVAANLLVSGSFLHDQIINNDTDVSTLTTNLNTTGQLLDEEVDSVAANLIITGSKIKWQESAGNIFYNEGGRVGIGTENPQTTLHVTGDVHIGGNLTVTGTTTTIDSVTLTVDDKNIELGSVDSPSDITADGGGITLKGTTDKTILFENDTDSWDFSEHLTTADGKHILTDKIKARDGDGLHLVDDADNGIFIEDGGMVGVGKADPQALLHVGGKAIVDGNLEVSGIIPSLVTTGSFLHDQILGNDTDISSLTTNLVTTGSFVHNAILNLTSEDLTWSYYNAFGDLPSAGSKHGMFAHVHGEGAAYFAHAGAWYKLALDSDLITTGSFLHDQIISNDLELASINSSILISDNGDITITGDLFVQNDVEISGDAIITGKLGVARTGESEFDLHVGTGEFASFMVTTGGLVGIGTDNPTAKFHINSDGLTVSGFRMTDGNQANNRVLTCDSNGNASWKAPQGGSSSDVVTTGSFLHNQILSNDSDISTLTTNLITTGSFLHQEIQDTDVGTVTNNLVTTGSFLHNQITSNDGDITTLTNNLITTGSFLHNSITDLDTSTLETNLNTTGQLLDEEVDSVAANLVITGSFVHDQILSNDSDISTLTANTSDDSTEAYVWFVR